ncbi:MAG: long-chain N-acyl amino acid synthase [Herminiimonas sp.]|nr:long-chain N-acyl amino acid synthase [Herminiimonas sp.]
MLNTEQKLSTSDPADVPKNGVLIAAADSDFLIEQKTGESQFTIRLANSAGLREKASLLIRQRYGWRGYSVDSPLQEAPNAISLVAEAGGETVATITLRYDTHGNGFAGSEFPETGLPADENFHDQLQELRTRGRRMCEASRLAIAENVPKRVFAALIHIAYMYTNNIHHYTDFIIEVNPRHVMFYRKMLGFRTLGEERMCSRVNAPAVLMRLELTYMTKQIQQFAGMYETHGKNRTFYPYFFPLKDELGITGRLRNHN